MTAVEIPNPAAKSNAADHFFSTLATAEKALSAVSEELAGKSWRAGGWSRKQVLGHLCDSAVNNHLRIVRAILDGKYDGPEYEQERWVELHGYAELSWRELFEMWRLENRFLGQAIANAPASALNASVKIGKDEMSLSAWIEDYLAHLVHHLEQIVKSS